MNFMKNIVDDSDIDDDVQIAIEYNIPLTSKRVDFMISGADNEGKDNIVIIELKQWQHAEIVDDQMHFSVRTFVANDQRIVCHPSYQAYSYSKFISNYSEAVADGEINLIPCAYLHNYSPESKSVLSDEIHREWYTVAPFFIKNEVKEFSDFVKKYIRKKSSCGDALYTIEYGRLRPTKSLQDTLVSLVKGNKEFTLLDEQAVCYDMCLKTMGQCHKDGQKRTIVIQGGSGTGKSVLAVNLLMEAIAASLNACYVTKNSAPRNAFLNILTSGHVMNRPTIEHLFRSPFGLSNCAPDTYDCMIIDEAHRLMKKMYGDWGGENQVKECIDASTLSIFLIDEDQAITIAEIKKWCKELGSRMIMTDETHLIELANGFKAKWNLAEDKIWAINPNSFEEVGCIHTAQGLEFDYAGVIIGKDLTYDPKTHTVRTNKNAISRDDKSSGIRTATDDVARRLIMNTYKTLLTRSQKGCYVYCEDDNLREYLKSRIQKTDNPH